jgi:hypothetical protein
VDPEWHVRLLLLTLHYACFSSQKGEEELMEYFRHKYSESSAAERYGEGEEMSDEIMQQGLLPGVK